MGGGSGLPGPWRVSSGGASLAAVPKPGASHDRRRPDVAGRAAPPDNALRPGRHGERVEVTIAGGMPLVDQVGRELGEAKPGELPAAQAERATGSPGAAGDRGPPLLVTGP
jgi:hypothetical protein